MEDIIIGRITTTGNEFSTTDYFQFWTNVDVVLDILDIVKVKRRDGSFTYGSIESIKQVSDAADHLTNYISCGFGEPNYENKTKRVEFNLITARFVCNKPATEDTPELHTPPVNNDKVYLCTAEEIQQAMGLTGGNRIPFGYMEMYGGKVKVGVELLSRMILNPDGAHMNISGISGLAAKTTSTMAVLNAIQQKLATKERIAFVFFNVKGEDLMAIDQPAEEITDKKLIQGINNYQSCFPDIKHEPFENVTYYHPACDMVPGENINHYHFPYLQCKDNLELIFAGDDDVSGTMDSVIRFISSDDKKVANIESWKILKDSIKNFAETTEQEGGISNRSFDKAFRIVNTVVTDDSIFTDKIGNENGKKVSDLITSVSNIKVGQIAVIDIHSLRFCEQAFVLGSVQKALAKTVKVNKRTKDKPVKFVIFVDELNKFAPVSAGKEKAVEKILEEIAERGRTEGTILFSAEQFRSSVDPNITGNCSTNLYGRTNAMELANSLYKNISPACQTMMTNLKPGECVLFSPELVSFVKVKFPYPAYKLPGK